MNKPRIAASTYLNSLPLCWSFLHGAHRERCTFIGDLAPARCAQMLERGEVDAALIPSIEYQRLPDVLLVPGATVAVKGAVRSVILLSKKPLDEITSVTLDLSSRTAAALTRIFFRHFLRREVSYRTSPPDLSAMLEDSDAVLLIGDPALIANYYNKTLHITDWGELWKQLTGLPFAFAVWAVRQDAVDCLSEVDFDLAKQEAKASIPALVDEAAVRLNLPYEYVKHYLTHSIHYDLDDECLAGLQRFFELAGEVGLVETVKPIEFFI